MNKLLVLVDIPSDGAWAPPEGAIVSVLKLESGSLDELRAVLHSAADSMTDWVADQAESLGP